MVSNGSNGATALRAVAPFIGNRAVSHGALFSVSSPFTPFLPVSVSALSVTSVERSIHPFATILRGSAPDTS
jgi:hypothetical protein